ncbi:MAG: ABC transporter permease [Lentisphaeraceae bacterium]|nr:ABC transporter permease [Lentisphaeraceae bacterium]
MIQLTRQFALFKQTILNDTRSVGIQLLKFLFAAALGLMVYITQAEASRWRHIDGRYIFEMIYGTNLFFVLAACLFLFLPLVKEEKEENTLGMIMMTGISPFAYLLGRFGSRLFMFFLILLVQIPVTYICITMGGIDIPTILLSYGFLLVIAFHLGSAFLLGSLLCSSILSGIFIACGLSLIFTYIMDWGISIFTDLRIPGIILGGIETCFEFIFATKTPTLTGNPLIISYLIFLIVTGILFFLVSVYFFDSLTAEMEEVELPKKLKGKKNADSKQAVQKSFLPRLRLFGSRRFSRFAILSKDFRFAAYGAPLYVVQICFMYWLYSELDSYDTRSLNSLSYNLLDEYFFIACGTVLVSSNFIFSSEIKNKTLSSLLLLPQSHVKLYWQKALSTIITAAPSLIAFITLISLNIFTNDSDGYPNRDMAQYLIFFAIIVPAYFINSWLSLVFEKYSFFLSTGITFGWFVLQIFIINMVHIGHEFEIFFFTCSGAVCSFITMKLALRKLKSHSLSS